MDLARLSNDLFGVTVVIYSLALLAYAADFAFTRRTAAVRVPAQQRVGGRVLATVGAPSVTTGPAAGDSAPTAPAPVSAGGTPLAGRLAVAVTCLGWLVHLAEVITRGLASGRVPWGNMYEFSSAVSLIAVGAFLLLLTRQPVRWLGLFVLLPVVLYLGLAGTVLFVSAGPLVPALNSYWIKIHVAAAILATGTFVVGGVVTVLHLLRRRHERRASIAGRPARSESMLDRLPEAAALERTAHRLISFAFPIWTFAIIAGAIWAESAWGRYWGWDPKETWSFVTWVMYAAYLHARSTASWRKAAPYVALAAFVGLLINYYVVNTVIAGLHSYAF